MLKVYLDDMREAPEGFILFRENAISAFIHLGRHADVISFDHDLGDKSLGMTGYDVLCVFEKEVYAGELWLDGAPEILVHSANPVGRERMASCISSIYKKVGRRPNNQPA